MKNTALYRLSANIAALGFAIVSNAAALAVELPKEDSSWLIYSNMQSQAQARGLPITALDGDWSNGYKPESKTQQAWQSLRFEAGVGRNFAALAGGQLPLRMGLLVRSDATAELSPDTANVLYYYQSRTKPTQARQWRMQAEVQSWTGQGLALHIPLLATEHWQVQLEANLLQLSRLRSTSSAGQGSIDALGDWGFALAARDDSSRLTAPFMPAPKAKGSGQSLSLDVAWRSTPDSAAWQPKQLQLRWADAYSRLRWNRLVGNDLLLNSQVTSYTPEGYLEVSPLITGQYRSRSLQRRIAPQWSLAANWELQGEQWGLSGLQSWARYEQRLGLQQYWVGLQGQQQKLQWQFGLEPIQKAISVGANWRGLKAQVAFDKANSGAHLRQWQLGWQGRF